MPPPAKSKVSPTTVAPSIPVIPSICKNCKFWEKKSLDLGACHREPPKIILGKVTDHGLSGVFPIVESTSWCGEFKSP